MSSASIRGLHPMIDIISDPPQFSLDMTINVRSVLLEAVDKN
jgi:hypothetical protein